MSQPFARPSFCLALAVALAASLALVGCGRKGPLEAPPAASVAGEKSVTPIGGEAKDDDAGVTSDGRAQAPKGENKRIFLDGLLN